MSANYHYANNNNINGGSSSSSSSSSSDSSSGSSSSTGFQGKSNRDDVVRIVTNLWGILVRFPVTAELSIELQVTRHSHPASSSAVSLGDFTGLS